MGECSLNEKAQRRIRKCHSKVAYPSDWVNAFAERYKQHPYPCGLCGWYHLTSQEPWSEPTGLLNIARNEILNQMIAK